MSENEKKPQKKSLVNIFKMKRIPILQADVDLGITVPRGFDLKSLKKKLGIQDSVETLTGRELISVAGETISFIENTGLEDLEPAMLDLEGFKKVYLPEDFNKNKINILIQTYKRIFPFSKLGKDVDTFLPVCKEDENTTDWKLMKPLLESLRFRLETLRRSIINQRSLPSDSVTLRSQLAQFNNLDDLITSLQDNSNRDNCMKKEEEEEEVVEEDISLLLRKFAFLLLLRQKDRSVDTKNLVEQLEEAFPIKLEEYEPEMRKEIRKFLDLTSQKTRGGGNSIEDKLETLDAEMKKLSNVIQAIEIKDTPTKKEKRELVKKQKELNSLFKKRVSLEETLSEMAGEYTIESKQMPDLVDAIYPELQNSKFLKFEKRLNEKLRH